MSNTWCEQVQLGAGGFARQILRPKNPDAAVNKMLTKVNNRQNKYLSSGLFSDTRTIKPLTVVTSDYLQTALIEQGGFARQILLAAVNKMLLKGKTQTKQIPVQWPLLGY